MRAALILALARVIRRPMVASCTRKARAISGTVRPPTMRSVSATRVSIASAGCGGYAVDRPPLDGGRERLGRRLLGDVEVTEPPGQGGDHPRPLLVVGLGDRLPDVDHAHSPRNGRTSTFRLQAFEPSAASSSAASRSAAWMIQKPARYSFDSTKGPSVTIASSRRLLTTLGALGAGRPPA